VKEITLKHMDRMGRLHNTLTEEIDRCNLTPEEVVLVLEMLSLRIKQLMLGMAGATR
jgi:hypothetical protein